jgi:hypothetical protein
LSLYWILRLGGRHLPLVYLLPFHFRVLTLPVNMAHPEIKGGRE